MHGQSAIIISLLFYPVILLGLLITAITLEFNKSRRHLGVYFLAAAIGSILGFVGGFCLATVFESLVQKHGLPTWIPFRNTEMADLFVFFALLVAVATSTILFALSGPYLVFLHQQRKKLIKRSNRI